LGRSENKQLRHAPKGLKEQYKKTLNKRQDPGKEVGVHFDLLFWIVFLMIVGALLSLGLS
jgi:hypothetical protein